MDEENGRTMAQKDYEKIRDNMVETQILPKGVEDPQVLEAMRTVPRHLFVPKSMIDLAYDDCPLPIGSQQTISQPYIVAYMSEALKITKEDRVLEIGTGSAYQTAVLSFLAKEVYSIEIIEGFSKSAKELLLSLGINNVVIKWGDGNRGWQENAPYDAIIVTAAPQDLPIELVKQLKIGGRMVIPVGNRWGVQALMRYLKTEDDSPMGYKLISEKLLPVVFVPMTGDV